MPSAADCQAAPLLPLTGALVRITDRQGESGTADLVDGLLEQARLEQLIDTVKPPIPCDWADASEGRPMPSHPLLLTPFRYPPLISGSRFGRPHQRHLFYGARSLETALAERSFHALRMLEDSPLPEGARLQRLQTAFSVEITAKRGLSLQTHLTPEALSAITDPSSYAASQRCGDAMRERGVQAFEVPSARSPQTPPVVGVLTPYAFSSTPFDFQDWTLEISAEGVTAVSFAGGLKGTFAREQFLVDGRWPVP
ncbi:RES domain-containing protein [Cyanobium gracile PCC 6307]|uniref:RES domain-containing protein n=1 Tax=Cyanobium gracile (strain ATCC 27147 / PCC 6307) TaxID=292564 RepID=K9P408_CYAGP|nr:RES domain-containing protein [Cyanobium gracile PCC 6307]